jgi:hypothetical protein
MKFESRTRKSKVAKISFLLMKMNEDKLNDD